MAGELLLFEEYFSVLQLKLCCNTYCFLAVQQLNSFFIFDLTNEWKNAFMHTMNIPSMVMWDSSIRTGVSSFESVIPTKTLLLVVLLFNVALVVLLINVFSSSNLILETLTVALLQLYIAIHPFNFEVGTGSMLLI